MYRSNLDLSEKWQLTCCECFGSLVGAGVLLYTGNKMAQWLKMWWIIDCKCHGSSAMDVKAYFMVVYLVAFVGNIQY